MIWKHFLMAIYLLAVSFYPCTDSDGSITAYNALEITQNHENHSHNDHQDACPPFCVCNCCGVQMLNYVSSTTYEFPVQFQTILLKESFYASNLSDSYSGTIWQPPQLI